MKVLDIAVKSLREQVRQPKTLAMTLGLPVVFMLIFGIAFDGSDANRPFLVAVVNNDSGDLGDRYVDGLRNLTYDDGSPLLRVNVYEDAEAARGPLEKREEDGLVVIPRNFTQGLTPTMRDPNGPAAPIQQPERGPPSGTEVTLVGDPSFRGYAGVSRIVDAYTRAFGEQATGQNPPVRVQESRVTSDALTEFDFIAPGLMVFAILNMVPAAASILAREAESGTLDRIRQSPTRAATLLGGVTIAQVVVAAASMALMLAAAKLLGFNNQGSYLLAYAIAMGAALSAVGIGMIVAALAKTQTEAANVGTLVAVPASFLSGAFFELPPVTLFTWGEREIGLYDVIPTTHAVDAMRAVLTFGRGTDAVVFSVAALAVLGLVAFAIGVGLYRRNRLAPA